MNLDRRTVLTSVLAGGVALTLEQVSTAGMSSAPQEIQEEAQNEASEKPATKSAISDDNDRKAIMSAGFTEAEADCWKLIAQAAGKFFELPELHPMDNSEVATAIHVIQNKLLSRPTYRTYVANAKKLMAEDSSR